MVLTAAKYAVPTTAARWNCAQLMAASACRRTVYRATVIAPAAVVTASWMQSLREKSVVPSRVAQESFAKTAKSASMAIRWAQPVRAVARVRVAIVSTENVAARRAPVHVVLARLECV